MPQELVYLFKCSKVTTVLPINIVFVETNQDNDKESDKGLGLDNIKAVNSQLDENSIDDDDKEFEEDLPIVRSYYDGNTVYITPSCISACMTFLNMDYKYFAGSKDPIEIINKYRSRGFGTILNENEIKRLLEYSSVVPKMESEI